MNKFRFFIRMAHLDDLLDGLSMPFLSERFKILPDVPGCFAKVIRIYPGGILFEVEHDDTHTEPAIAMAIITNCRSMKVMVLPEATEEEIKSGEFHLTCVPTYMDKRWSVSDINDVRGIISASLHIVLPNYCFTPFDPNKQIHYPITVEATGIITDGYIELNAY